MTIKSITANGEWTNLSLSVGTVYEIHEANGFNFFYSTAATPDSTIDGTPIRDGERLIITAGANDKVICEFGKDLNLVCNAQN